jgi:pimeloyl-ACP methyl ester carboxylesterase
MQPNMRKMDISIEDGFLPVTIVTSRGNVTARHYRIGDEKKAVIYVGGVGGGFDTPALGLYPKLCRDLLSHGIGGLRIQFRYPTNLRESVFDVTTGISFLHEAGVESLGLVGHSYGGAVVIQAGAGAAEVKTIVTLSTQSYGTGDVVHFQDKSLLLIHGVLDEILPPSSSQLVYQLAPEPKKLVFLEKAHHVLDEAADEVFDLVCNWILENLK